MEADYFATHWVGLPRYHQFAIGPRITVIVPGLDRLASERYLRRSQYRPDDIVVESSTYHILEFKWQNVIDAIRRLPVYRDLLLQDERFPVLTYADVRLRAVIPYINDFIISQAMKAGVELEIFRPDYIITQLTVGFPSQQRLIV